MEPYHSTGSQRACFVALSFLTCHDVPDSHKQGADAAGRLAGTPSLAVLVPTSIRPFVSFDGSKSNHLSPSIAARPPARPFCLLRSNSPPLPSFPLVVA